jgi:hypothetical protein
MMTPSFHNETRCGVETATVDAFNYLAKNNTSLKYNMTWQPHPPFILLAQYFPMKYCGRLKPFIVQMPVEKPDGLKISLLVPA